MSEYVIPFEKLRNSDVGIVGGKNASLGEMISQLSSQGVRVPTGFATTSSAFNDFLECNELDSKIIEELENLDINDTVSLVKSGKKIRQQQRPGQQQRHICPQLHFGVRICCIA